MANNRRRSALKKVFKSKDCIRFKNCLRNYPTATTSYFFVLPIHDKNKYYKQCNRQLNCEWSRKRKRELKKLEAVKPLPSYVILESAYSDRVQVIAYCSLSKIPSCAKRDKATTTIISTTRMKMMIHTFSKEVNNPEKCMMVHRLRPLMNLM
ncbi:uncharacterized protein LOC5565331 isoform X2 [Aedes aegypti]|uniref:Uncharacterized protein n=1 Tax=Aedes aegypti TaxID=7159 RepID=A0A6I8TGC8_AEDAE|nr:uncharacterized protein LOC5565331 isoform X2 [Aedes aegypti]